MNGKVIIGTELSTTQLEKDLNKSKKELEKFEKEEERLLTKKQKLEIDVTKSENALQSLDDKLAIVNKKITEMKEIKLPEDLETSVDYQKLLAQYNAIDGKAQEYYQTLEMQKTQITQINSKLKDNASIQNELNATINNTSKKIENFSPPDPNKWGDAEKRINNINNSLSKTVKRVANWGIAIFGIRTAYGAVRSAMSTLEQYDTQMANNVKYIQYALANTLLPVIQTILNLVVKLLQYINYIVKAWTGKNLFKTAGAFKDAQKNAKGLNKELNKTVASFDEMNVLSDSSSAGGSGVSDIATPNIDLTGLQGEVPQWLQWIVDHKDEILAIMAGVATGLFLWKLGLEGIQALGIGVAIAGIVYAIESLMDYIEDPSWENFGKIIVGIGIAIIGLGIAFGSLPVIIAGVIVLILGIIIENWEKIKDFFQKGIDWLKSKDDKIREKFGDYVGDIYDIFVDNLQNFLDIFDSIFKGMKGGLDGIIQFITGIFSGNWKQAWDGLVKTFGSIFGGLVGVVKSILKIIWNLLKGLALTVAQVVSELFKTVINGVLKVIETVLNTPIKTINKLIDVINKVPGINLGTLPTFKLPRLAKGGIINQPGRGIPVGSAIGGERGQEGVLPLTDSQQMALLGEAIGKYININLTNITKLDNRQIAREQMKINAQNNFAFNR